MLVETLLDTKINISYRFMVLGDETGGDGERSDATRGQRNGLCGAALPGELHLITGLHTGDVGVRIELHSDEPALGDEWEEAVEATFATTSEDLTLSSFDDRCGPIDLPPGTYRVRYCARGLQHGHEVDVLDPGATPVDHYLLQFWPGGGPERILRQSGAAAAYWHREGTEPSYSPDELAARVRELRTDRAERRADEAALEESEWWDEAHHRLHQSLPDA
jgi:hypothetical protein